MAISLSNVDVVLLDIEGTICPISFVKDTLFPYALRALPEVLRDRWNDAEFQPYKNAFPEPYRASPEILQAHVEDLTERDVKIAYLKNLQGYLWQAGYESRAYATPLFPDVIPSLKRWSSQFHSRTVAIYSSGSVFAQKLLFRHVKTDTATDPDPQHVNETEDLTDMVADWFDTVNAGPKTEPTSYVKIAEKLAVRAARVLFFSDSIKEVGAAINAGMAAVLVVRPGNAVLDADARNQYHVITSFDEIQY